jgi:hypothetical protein
VRSFFYAFTLACLAAPGAACEFHGGGFGPFAGMYGRGLGGVEAAPAAATPLPDREQAMAAARAAFIERFKVQPAPPSTPPAHDSTAAPSVIAHN